MSKIVNFLLWLIPIIIVLITGVLIYIKTALPDVGEAPELTIKITEERLQRGEYVALHVTLCIDCHAERDWNKFGGPPKEGSLGAGGEIFKREWGFPGEYYAGNITPYGVGDWTDGELFRAITSGVSKDGKALFPVMPYLYFGKIDKEDIYSIIAYIRTLEPVEKENIASVSGFPFNFIINTIPKKPEFITKPVNADKLEYGEYLSIGCLECHTQAKKGRIIPELAFAGGRDYTLPTGGVVRSSNITFDTETGIGKWSEEVFIRKFKQYADSNFVPQYIGENEFNTIMPWTMYAGLTNEDLSALYIYLKSVKTIQNEVVKFTVE
ncbi:MAG: hypothetical protein K8R86_13035 [Bacteroidales bacterium]|nr:hypothetical protein [Bacteroidales bacterium]